ncbi:MAG: alpha-1,4-glucan--maltose-1-phosphate maltosyltransferase [Phycisphaeraceae bacterium]|nr:alpha-1,4-glucan--maltose-1-phosphate maltosyltransferase [Phycisphaeraceae bacterium]
MTRVLKAAVNRATDPRPTGVGVGDGGRSRVVIELVSPCVDNGRFPAKRATGESVRVTADIFADGHDRITAVVRHRHSGASDWLESPMSGVGNDRWVGEFIVPAAGRHEYVVQAWINPFVTWRADLEKRLKAAQDVSVDLLIGADLVAATAAAIDGDDSRALAEAARQLRSDSASDERAEAALDERILQLMLRHAERSYATTSPTMSIVVDRLRALYSTWYELFPRSASPDPSRHGTFKDVEGLLPDIARMGFDVLYLPPIHPIGRSFRKGPNNSATAGPDDVGSPWAIGAKEGGHRSIHPDLGTMADFEGLVAAAGRHGMEIALDLAFQCSPDHPYVREHPEWFRRRPDGTIQYAENPPKKYQDIYPFDFESEAWESLWAELLGVVLHWCDRGVRIFRVDNPHTKAFPFWEWLIESVKRKHQDVLFLAEAFTRPRVMQRLAKLGFTQSYTYFAWRNLPWEIREYFTELTRTGVAEYFRPNAWPNTPDILTEYLQHGGRPAAMARIVLAATLCASYGVYGPPLETGDCTPVAPGSEEYLNSEKYQRRVWDFSRPDSLREFLTRINRIRRENAALQQDRTLTFHDADNPSVVCYSKSAGPNRVLCIVNTDPHRVQWSGLGLDLGALGLKPDEPFQVHDLLTDARYLWKGPRNVVGLDPAVCPAHVFAIRSRGRSERDFEYFL